jgi:uncharacterized protein (DUF58 family)
MSTAPLVDAGELRQLERLRYAQLDAVLSGLVGRPVGAAGGRGLEFAEYRPYTPGDDLRRLDANVYARLRQPVVKSSPAERQLGLALLLDGSGSMEVGVGRHASRLAALLGCIALLRGDRVRLSLLVDGSARPQRQLWGPRAVGALLEQVELTERGDRTDLPGSILATGAEAHVAVLISDGLVPEAELDEAVIALAGRGDHTAFVQVIDESPLEDETGAVELIDTETGERQVVSLTNTTRDAYNARLEALVTRTTEICTTHGVAHLRATITAEPLDQLLDLVGPGLLLERTR